jgi:hypothetical protein
VWKSTYIHPMIGIVFAYVPAHTRTHTYLFICTSIRINGSTRTNSNLLYFLYSSVACPKKAICVPISPR